MNRVALEKLDSVTQSLNPGDLQVHTHSYTFLLTKFTNY